LAGKKYLHRKKQHQSTQPILKKVVGIFQKAGKDEAEAAMQAAAKAFESWKKVPAAERADYLFKAAEEVRRRRLEINALDDF
jgi:1-pyrroline-5-carboxylate dehydrogenase